MSTGPAARRWMRPVAGAAAAVLVVLTFAAVGRFNAGPTTGAGATAADGDPRTVGAKAPGLTALAVDGQQVVVPGGKPTVLFFFATNCATCVVTAEAMGQLDRTLASRVSFVAVDLVPNDD